MNVEGPEGKIFAGRYRINRLLGKGGMAHVYLATDMTNGVNVSIKVLKPELSNDEEFVKRFDSEAKAIAMLSHSNIVKVFGVGNEGSYRYIVQEYVDGITVKELINQNGYIDWRVAVPIIIQVGLALDHAHRNGIIHRDIKPQNILINREKIPKITDFGIARANTTNTITMTNGGAFGSVHYISPEQSRGGNVGPQSDIYSLGVMLFEMVTGRVPFDGENDISVALKHLQEPIPKASSFVLGIPAGLDSIIIKCMQKSPNLRYQSAKQLVSELDELMNDPNGVYGNISNVEKTENEPNMTFRPEVDYGKIDEFEETIDNHKVAKTKNVAILAVIITVIIGVLIGVVFYGVKLIKDSTDHTKGNEYVVEDYVGMELEVARKRIEEAGIDFDVSRDVQYEDSDDAKKGIVLSQKPPEGTSLIINKDARIILVVSKGKGEKVLPDYSGMDYKEAKEKIAEDGFIPQLGGSEESNEFSPNHVTRTDPPAGTLVNPDEQKIIIYFAVEPKTSVIPNVSKDSDGTPISLVKAEEMLSKSGLKPVINYINSDTKDLDKSELYTLYTTPKAGTEVSRGSNVTLYVSNREDFDRGGTPTPVPAQVDVKANISGSGKVEGTGEFKAGTSVTVKAVPNDGSNFVRWENASGTNVSTDLSYTFTIPVSQKDDYILTAVFEEFTPTPLPAPREEEHKPTEVNPNAQNIQ